MVQPQRSPPVPEPAAAAKPKEQWDKIPKKGAKGRAKKGVKVDGAMLGFATGVDYSVLERDS